jgi:late competence protein required for DNA uptake (superfamily II DNA/RNA helicase)
MLYTMAELNPNRKAKFAWFRYFEELNAHTTTAIEVIRLMSELKSQGEIPSHISKEFIEMANQLQKRFTCPICLNLVSTETVAITLCGHIYCKVCLETVKKSSTKKCAICRKPFSY